MLKNLLKMRNYNLQRMNLRELTESEQREINGGILPLIFIVACYVGYKRAERADAAQK